jgi:hypothetical protein
LAQFSTGESRVGTCLSNFERERMLPLLCWTRSFLIAGIIAFQLVLCSTLVSGSCDVESLVWSTHVWWSLTVCVIRLATDHTDTSVVVAFLVTLCFILRTSIAPIPAVLLLLLTTSTVLPAVYTYKTGTFSLRHAALPFRMVWLSLYALVICQVFSGVLRVGGRPWPYLSHDDVLVSVFRAHHWRDPAKNAVLVCLPLFMLLRCEQYISQRGTWLDPETMWPQISISAVAVLVADSLLTQLVLFFAVVVCSAVAGHAVRWKQAALKML